MRCLLPCLRFVGPPHQPPQNLGEIALGKDSVQQPGGVRLLRCVRDLGQLRVQGGGAPWPFSSSVAADFFNESIFRQLSQMKGTTCWALTEKLARACRSQRTLTAQCADERKTDRMGVCPECAGIRQADRLQSITAHIRKISFERLLVNTPAGLPPGAVRQSRINFAYASSRGSTDSRGSDGRPKIARETPAPASASNASRLGGA